MAKDELLRAMEAELADAEQYAASLRVAVEAVRGKHSPSQRTATSAPPGVSRTRPSRTTGKPTTQPLLISILEESDRTWNTRELADEMLRRGWETSSPKPTQAVKATAARLVNAGRIARVSEGVYARRTPGGFT